LSESEPTGVTHLYRVSCYPAFGDNLVVSIQLDDTGAGSAVARRSRTVRSASERLISTWRRSVSQAEVSRFLERIDEMDFWNLPPQDPLAWGYDGQDWKLEGYRNGKSHIVKRWSPEPGAFLGSAIQLLKYADLAGCTGHRPLSQFELSRLKVLAIRNDTSGPAAALVEAPDGAIDLVKVGHGIGADFGVIRAITPDYIELTEVIRDCTDDMRGEWRERVNYLPRNGAAVRAEFSTIVTAVNAERERMGVRCVSSP